MTDEIDGGAGPAPLAVEVSVDGAQRLIDAWKDGRLEKALGFPIEALQIQTPFSPTPPAGGPGAAPASPPAGAAAPSLGKRKSLGSKLGLLAVLIAIGLLLWFSEERLVAPVEEPEVGNSGGGSRSAPTRLVPGVVAEPVPDEPPDVAIEPSEPATGSETGFGLSPAMEPASDHETGSEIPTGGEATGGEATGGEPPPMESKNDGPKARKKARKKAQKKAQKKKGSRAQFSRYHCSSEDSAFAMVVHARSMKEAKKKKCGGSSAEESAECIATTSCTLVED